MSDWHSQSPDAALFPAALCHEAERWVGAQGEVWAGFDASLGGWMRRQREALDTAARTVEKMARSRDLGELLQAQHELAAHCVQWTLGEVRAVGDAAATLARRATERFCQQSAVVVRHATMPAPAAPAPSEQVAAG